MTTASALPSSYTWRDLSFQLPQNVVDQTVVTLVQAGPTPAFNISVTTDRVPAGGPEVLEAYIAGQMKQLSQHLSGYRLASRREQIVAGMPAVLLDQRATLDGAPIRQLQAYIRDGERAIIVTATCQESGIDEAGKALELVLSTLGTGRNSPQKVSP